MTQRVSIATWFALAAAGCALAGCGGSPSAPPAGAIRPGGQPLPVHVRRMLAALPPSSRPTRAARVSAALVLGHGTYAGRRLVLVAYPSRAGGCVEQTYLTAVGSMAYSGLGVTGGRCEPPACGICAVVADESRLGTLVALVTDRADTLRVTFATDLAAAHPTVFHHDYALRGPRVTALRRRVFMLDRARDMSVLSLDALRHGHAIAHETIAGIT